MLACGVRGNEMLQKLLVGTDTSAAAGLPVEAAAGLVVLYVKPPLDAREIFDPVKLPDPDGYLGRMRERFPEVKVRTRSEAGDAAEMICDVAEGEEADAIGVGNRGTHGKRRWFLGSVPNAVVQHAPCSVFIVDTRSAQ